MADITDKIRKLLELAKSDNEHEAAAAAARAAELMVTHQIELAEIEAAKPESERKPEAADVVVLETFDRTVSWKWFIQAGLADAFGGVAYYSWNRDPKLPGHQTAVVAGPKSALDAIAYMYSFLAREIDRLADEGYRLEHKECHASMVPTPPARGWKNAFRIGAALVIRNRLVAQNKATIGAARKAANGKPAASSTALAIIDRQVEVSLELVRKMAPGMFRKDGKMRAGTSVTVNTRSGGYSAGRSAGENVNLGGGRQLGAGKGQLR